MRRPPLAQAPRRGEVFGDALRFGAGGAGYLAESAGNGLAQHRSERLVSVGAGQNPGSKLGHGRLGGAVHRRQAELRRQVHEHLVALRRDAVRQRLDGVGVDDLLGPQLRVDGEQHVQRVGRGKGKVLDGPRRGSRRRSGRRGRRFLRGRILLGSRLRLRIGGRRCLSGVGGRFSRLRLAGLFNRGRGHVLAPDALRIPRDVHDSNVRARLGDGPRPDVGEGRRGGEANLDPFAHALLQEHVLRINPLHGRGELPREKLNEQRADDAVAVALEQAVEVLDKLGHHRRRGDVEDEPRELLRQLEGLGHEVGYVAAHEGVGLDLLGQQVFQKLAEVVHPVAQDARVEGHVNAGNEDERSLAARGLGPGVRVALQGLKARDGSGHGVLLALDVEVDDLKELARLLGDRFDVADDVAHPELAGAKRPHAVV